VRKVQARSQRALQNRPIRGDCNVPTLGLDQDCVFSGSHALHYPKSRRQKPRFLAAAKGPRLCAASAAPVKLEAAAKDLGSARPVPRQSRINVFRNPHADKITELLRATRIIAVVGLSADPSRPSNRVAQQLQGFGYRIIPVTPSGGTLLGEESVADLDHLADVLKPGERVDVVDVFRRPEHVAAIVEDCIRLRLPALWLQDGVVDEGAAAKAVEAGIFTVMDRCIFRDRAALR
jgi:predicted CoA-binding protein